MAPAVFGTPGGTGLGMDADDPALPLPDYLVFAFDPLPAGLDREQAPPPVGVGVGNRPLVEVLDRCPRERLRIAADEIGEPLGDPSQIAPGIDDCDLRARR